jgi:hypothetical protein
MRTIAHIINVTEINEAKRASYLHVAQAVTIKSMIMARQRAERSVRIDLFAVKHKDETVNIPDEFAWASDISTYAWEHIDSLKPVLPHRPLPRLVDIIASLYAASRAEYFIYTNLDIGLYPHFYVYVEELIQKGFDAFCINRRTLPKEHNGALLDENQLDVIVGLEGHEHPGIDCFVFKREIVPALNLGNVYIGYPPIGQVLKTQIELNCRKFTWIRDGQLTFHLGDDLAWRGEGPYHEVNLKQAQGLFKRPAEWPTKWSQSKPAAPRPFARIVERVKQTLAACVAVGKTRASRRK